MQKPMKKIFLRKFTDRYRLNLTPAPIVIFQHQITTLPKKILTFMRIVHARFVKEWQVHIYCLSNVNENLQWLVRSAHSHTSGCLHKIFNDYVHNAHNVWILKQES